MHALSQRDELPESALFANHLKVEAYSFYDPDNGYQPYTIPKGLNFRTAGDFKGSDELGGNPTKIWNSLHAHKIRALASYEEGSSANVYVGQHEDGGIVAVRAPKAKTATGVHVRGDLPVNLQPDASIVLDPADRRRRIEILPFVMVKPHFGHFQAQAIKLCTLFSLSGMSNTNLMIDPCLLPDGTPLAMDPDATARRTKPESTIPQVMRELQKNLEQHNVREFAWTQPTGAPKQHKFFPLNRLQTGVRANRP